MSDFLEEILLKEWSVAAKNLATMAQDPTIIQQTREWSIRAGESLKNGGAVFFAGNGGSFADSQHMAAEFTGKMGRMRKSLPGIALGTNSSSMSAIGNDFGFDYSFARELEGLCRPHSLVFAMSTSGNSVNIVELAKTAKRLEIPMVCLTGFSESEVGRYCDVIQVPTNRTERVQELHTLIGHSFCLLVEEYLGLSDEPWDANSE